MKAYKLIGIIAAFFLFTSFSDNHVINIFMIGDSTMANKDISGDKQERGWGMVLRCYFTDDVRIHNHAVNGRSSKSFIDEGRWQRVLDQLKPGDYVFIQFGHNDEKPSADRHTNPGTTFDDNLARFVLETREKGAIPVLFNAVVRRNFYNAQSMEQKVDNNNPRDDEALRNTTFADLEENINSDTLIDTHGQYIVAPRNVANRLHVPFVDANRITHDIEQGAGIIGSRRLHMWFKPGEHPSVPDGRKDNTHYNVYGAHVVASHIVDEIGRKVPALTPFIHHYDIYVANDGSGHYFRLQDALRIAEKHLIPSPSGKGLVRAGNKITILVDSTSQKTIFPKNNNIVIEYRCPSPGKTD